MINDALPEISGRPYTSICLVSLGCSKNLVDSEAMIGILLDEGYTITTDPSLADVIIVNTCGFIQAAKQEAIDKILEMADHKNSEAGPGNPDGHGQRKGKCRFLIVTGCLAQRYAREIADLLPEVDAVLGTCEYASIASTIGQLYASDTDKPGHGGVSCGPVIKIGRGDPLGHLRISRVPSTKVYAYLKISEGCSNNCAYCAIPGIRGAMVSRSIEDLTGETERLAGMGYTEIVLIAQDTTRYGQDLYGRRMLPDLITKISAVDGIRKIRLLYCYADGITPELIRVMADDPKVAKYIDIPIQHISDSVLRRMNRRDTSGSIDECIASLRRNIPDITIRTTVMTGFPGETDEDFGKLYDFVKRTRFDLLGCFVFSSEDDTAAHSMKPKVPKSVAKRRYNSIMKLQKAISYEKNQAWIGKLYKVTIDSPAPDGVFYLGRGDPQAPEIDPPVYVIAAEDVLETGTEYTVRIVDCSEYELTGVTYP